MHSYLIRGGNFVAEHLFHYPVSRTLKVLTFALLFIIGAGSNTEAQILIAGTSFDPSPGNAGRYYIGIDDVEQYGLQTGSH